MGTEDIQFLSVADDGPVHGGLFSEYAELDESAQLPDNGQALADTGGIAGCLDIDIASVSVRERLDLLIDIALARIEHQVGAELFCLLEAVRLHVQSDQAFRILHPCIGDHAKSEGSRSGDYHNILIRDLRAVHCMLGAAEGLDQKRLFQSHLFRNPADHAVLHIAHILSHSAVVVILIAVHVMRLAHPVMSVLAESALSAGNDLVGGDAVAQFIFRDVFTDLHNSSEELMAGNERRFDPCRLEVISPEHRDTVLALQVACTDPAAFRLDDDIIRSAFRRGICRLKAVIPLSVRNECLHSFRN